ncbi:gamma-tubulin complex component 2 [Citrus sinensis]|uniref:Gamma-tubulin complex component 2 n=1 Tax=Citrus sinensis TaxID=2711 RepID=A0ACB8IMJ0_CITSI|nr:gamma-tubulin complex component 2 [Citrus sinensis]
MEMSYPSTPRWNIERPFLTGRFHQETKAASRFADSFSNNGAEMAIGCYDAGVQELLVIDDLLSALVGIEGRYISIKRRVNHVHGNDTYDSTVTFQVDASMDLALQFVESRSQFKNGLVNHAFAASLRALLLDYEAMVAQLEHQFRLGRLSIQGLWFYCQPMLGSMQAVSAVIHKASANNFTGSAVLNLLQSQAKAMAGDNTVRSLLEKMTQCASNAYLGILERWVYEGVIDDPYGEFFIAEDKSLLKESLTQDYDAKYWRQRYSLKDGIPSFLANIAGKILTTGKYLNVMRECGHSAQVPTSENSKLLSFGSNHHYLECVKVAYEFASGELLNLIKERYDLMGKLRSIKRYLLLDQGDFLVHFMDIAREELMKQLDEITVEKLQSLLDIALRSTAAAADPCHEDLTCSVERSSLLKRMATLKGVEIKTSSDSVDLEQPVSITGLETFSLSYKVQWPLSIVISRKALTKYQMVFRLLFHCKHVERQLCGAWQVHQVLEPNWHVMHNRLQTAKSIDEVIQHHDFFLDKCLRECLLHLPDLLKKVERLKSLCLQYAAATQWLISSSTDLPKLEEPSDGFSGSEKFKQLKLRSLSQVQKVMIRDATVTESILKFEREFNNELQSLGPILSSSSQAEPYLTHLAQLVLGVGFDK